LAVRPTTLLLLATLPWATACAKNEELIRLESQVDQLRQQLQTMRQSQEATQAQLRTLQDALPQGVESRLEAAERADHAQGQRLETIEQSAATLVRRADDLDFRLAALSEEIRSLQQTIEQSHALAPGGGSGAEGDSSESRKPDEIYSAAYAEFQRGNYPTAIRDFRTLLNRYPQAELAEYAQYWIGECLLAQHHFEDAILEFDHVIQRYPHGDLVAAAYLKKGLAYVELNQIAQGVVQLQRLIEEFPRSREAQTARERLENLGLKGGSD